MNEGMGTCLNIAGVICEYNPFHNGHQYHLTQTRALGADAIVAVMSGNFVQRGDAAFVDKWSRAAAAVRCGADLVLELPVPWATASAADFAAGALHLLHAFGVDMLSFGCETDDLASLYALMRATDDEKVRALVQSLTAEGATYPAAMQQAVETVYDKATARLLHQPNSVLAAEYLKALQSVGGQIQPLVIRRRGADHDALFAKDGIMSASALRTLSDQSQAKAFVPPAAFSLQYAASANRLDEMRFETAMLTVLRSMDDDAVRALVDDRSGLADRIIAAKRNACSLNELYQLAKTRSITMAKVKRELLHLFLGVTPSMAKQKPPYLRVLAANQKGLSLLSGRMVSLSVITRHRESASLDDFAASLYALQCRATDLYALCCVQPKPCGEEQRHSMQILSDE